MFKKKSGPKIRSIYISDDIWDEIASISKYEGEKRSELVRIWIIKGIKHYYKVSGRRMTLKLKGDKF